MAGLRYRGDRESHARSPVWDGRTVHVWEIQGCSRTPRRRQQQKMQRKFDIWLRQKPKLGESEESELTRRMRARARWSSQADSRWESERSSSSERWDLKVSL